MTEISFPFDVALTDETFDGEPEPVWFDLDTKTATVDRNGKRVALPTTESERNTRPVTLLGGVDADGDGVADIVWLDVWISLAPQSIPGVKPDQPSPRKPTTNSGDGVDYYTRPVVSAISSASIPSQAMMGQPACYDLPEGGRECRQLTDVNGDGKPEMAIYNPDGPVRYEFTLPFDLPFPAEGHK